MATTTFKAVEAGVGLVMPYRDVALLAQACLIAILHLRTDARAKNGLSDEVRNRTIARLCNCAEQLASVLPTGQPEPDWPEDSPTLKSNN